MLRPVHVYAYQTGLLDAGINLELHYYMLHVTSFSVKPRTIS